MWLQKAISFILICVHLFCIFALANMIVEKCKPAKSYSNGKLCGGLAYTKQSQNQKQKTMEQDFQKVADLITAKMSLNTKEVLTTDEAASYMGVSKSYLYKLTMEKRIPHYKPMGKMCFFNRKEIEMWLQANRVATDEELSQDAQAYCIKKGGAR